MEPQLRCLTAQHKITGGHECLERTAIGSFDFKSQRRTDKGRRTARNRGDCIRRSRKRHLLHQSRCIHLKRLHAGQDALVGHIDVGLDESLGQVRRRVDKGTLRFLVQSTGENTSSSTCFRRSIVKI